MNTSVNNIEIIAISCCVPKEIKSNLNNEYFSSEEVGKFIETTGVEEFRVAPNGITTSDLGIKAAEEIFEKIDINKNDIDILVFVSQTPDYNNVPNTSIILQNKLGLDKRCVCFDVPLGCSGYTYGIQIISAFLQLNNFNYGLLICGDTPSKTIGKRDKSSAMLFGDAASATIVRRSSNNIMHFQNGSDGSGYKAIIIEDGGFRNQVSSCSFEEIDYGKSIIHNKLQLHLDGLDVFSFGITTAPASIKELVNYSKFDMDELDYLIMHQANFMMNEMIRKKLKVSKEKTLYSLKNFGNTSSASIPLSIVVNKYKFSDLKTYNCILSGFGVGLSWNSLIVGINGKTILNLIEL